MTKPNKRSVNIAGHPTSVSLEEPFWEALRQIAEAGGVKTAALIAQIDAERGPAGLSSAIRLYVLAHFRGEFGKTNYTSGTKE